MPCGWRRGWGDLSTVDKPRNPSVYNGLVAGVQGFLTFGVLPVVSPHAPSTRGEALVSAGFRDDGKPLRVTQFQEIA